LTLTENIENGFHIKFKINLFKNKLRQRNLQESSETQEVDLYLDNVSGGVATLTSQKEFAETDRVVVNKEQENDEYGLSVLNNDYNVLDTKANKQKIDNNEVVDFSEISSDFSTNKYYIESSSTGCSFNLVSKNSIKENNKEVNLIFTQKDDTNNNINAKCTLSSSNDKNIPCSIEQELDEKNYDLQSYVGSSSNSLFYIFQANDGYKLSCSEESKDKKKIIIIAAAGVVLLAIIITICCCCCKKKKVEKVENNEKSFKIPETKVISFNNNNNFNMNNNMSSYRGINNGRTNLFQ